MTYHDAEGFLHNINDRGLGFFPSLCSASLANVGLHLHQGLQGKRIKIDIFFASEKKIKMSFFLGLLFLTFHLLGAVFWSMSARRGVIHSYK